jgi:succinoglycan biosynthesis transport protein ExoP
MQRRPPTQLSDYLEVFLRRWRWVMIPAALIFVAVFSVSVKLPKLYRSETLILVDPQKVPSDYVKPTISGDVTDRLQTISQEILSRTRLQRIIDQFGLYKEQKNLVPEDIVELMRKDITLDIVTDPRGRAGTGVGGFKISYSGSTPGQAQQVTRQIASLFIEENLKVREQQAEGTNEFIESELNKARTALQDQEKKIKDFKAKYTGSLPEQQQSNLAVLSQYQTMLQNNSDALGRAEQQKTYLKSLLETLAKKPPAPPKADEAQVEAVRSQLIAAQQKYTPTHPDVVRLQRELKVLEDRAREAAAKEGPVVSDQPNQLPLQIKSLEMEITDRNRRQAELEGKIRALQNRVDVLPAVEQQFSELNRDYLISKSNYESLLQKQNSSAMAAEMEHRAKGEQFRVLDPASYPEKPSKPNLLQLNLGGLFGGLAFGIALATFQELRDRSLHTEKDISYYIPVTVLGSMPMIATEATMEADKKKKRRAWLFSSASASVLALFVLLIIYGKNIFGGHS